MSGLGGRCEGHCHVRGIKADGEVALSQVREQLQTRCRQVMGAVLQHVGMGQEDDSEEFLLEWMAQVLVKKLDTVS